MKRQVDQFAPGHWVPSCQLYVKWTRKQEQPEELVHRVKLVGAKEPFNFFSIQSPAMPPLPQSKYLIPLLFYVLNYCEKLWSNDNGQDIK